MLAIFAVIQGLEKLRKPMNEVYYRGFLRKFEFENINMSHGVTSMTYASYR